jgi:hypothetical protein
MGNICPGSNRRTTSRDISHANSNRSSIMQSLSNNLFRTSNRPQSNNSVNHNGDKNSNLVINGNNNYDVPATVPATNFEINSRSLPPVVVSDPATVAPPVPVKISDPNDENMKINENDNRTEPQSQSEKLDKNTNVAQSETRQIKQSPSASAKPKRKGSRKPHHRRVPSAAGLRVESVLNRKTEMMKDVYTVGNVFLMSH